MPRRTSVYFTATQLPACARAGDNRGSHLWPETHMSTFYDYTVDDIHGKPVKLDRYKGKVVLVVNTASKCGFTPQYKGLEKLYKDVRATPGGDDFVVLGFPCNQFG